MSWDAPEIVRRVAAERTRCHLHSKSNNQPPGDPNNTSIVGVAGEWLLAQYLGLPYPFEQYALQYQGDDGIDFTVECPGRPKPLTIDAKTARKPRWLYVPKNKLEGRAELFVLARYDDELGPALLGWEWRSVMRRMPVKIVESERSLSASEVIYRNARALQPMRKLRELIDSYKRRAA